jgi:hypothetical protein
MDISEFNLCFVERVNEGLVLLLNQEKGGEENVPVFGSVEEGDFNEGEMQEGVVSQQPSQRDKIKLNK